MQATDGVKPVSRNRRAKQRAAVAKDVAQLQTLTLRATHSTIGTTLTTLDSSPITPRTSVCATIATANGDSHRPLPNHTIPYTTCINHALGGGKKKQKGHAQQTHQMHGSEFYQHACACSNLSSTELQPNIPPCKLLGCQYWVRKVPVPAEEL